MDESDKVKVRLFIEVRGEVEVEMSGEEFAALDETLDHRGAKFFGDEEVVRFVRPNLDALVADASVLLEDAEVV